MKRSSRLPSLLLPAAALAFAACADTPSAVDDDFARASTTALPTQAQAELVEPGEVIVGLADGADAVAVGRAYGLDVASRGYRNAFVVMRGGAGNEVATAARLRADARVRFAEPNYLRQPIQSTIASRLWGFNNDGTLRMTYTRGGSGVVTSKLPKSDADIDATGIDGVNASDASTDVLVGSIDTGVDFAHPEFGGGTLIKGSDWISNDGNPLDEDNHGTHTSGTIAGLNVGVAGVTGANSGAQRRVKVYVQRVCGRRGCPSAAIANAIMEAADRPGMVAMNLSLGGSSISTAEQNAIKYAVNTKNVLVIASAGNDNTTTVSCPACDPLAISVAALNWADGLAYYSNRGTGLDVSAPGGEMYSNTSGDGGIYSSIRGGSYAYYQGTSMAAPMVTGIAGVVAAKTGLRGGALRDRLLTTADDLGAGGYDTVFGAGRVNLRRALSGQ